MRHEMAMVGVLNVGAVPRPVAQCRASAQRLRLCIGPGVLMR